MNILSIGGSDPSAGAGIQSDVKTFSNHNAYGFTVVTAITSQNTKKVTSIEPVSTKSLKTQMDSILSDFQVDAIKIGMVYNSQIIKINQQIKFIEAQTNMTEGEKLDKVRQLNLLKNEIVESLKKQVLAFEKNNDTRVKRQTWWY